jgi:hypothetical protein
MQVPSFPFSPFFNLSFVVFLCVSQQGEFETTIKLFEKNPCQKLFTKTLREKKILSFFFLRFLFIAFLAVSLHEKLKNTIQILVKKK